MRIDMEGEGAELVAAYSGSSVVEALLEQHAEDRGKHAPSREVEIARRTEPRAIRWLEHFW